MEASSGRQFKKNELFRSRAGLQKPSLTDGNDGAIAHSLGEPSTPDRYCGGFAKSNPSSHHWAISLEESACT